MMLRPHSCASLNSPSSTHAKQTSFQVLGLLALRAASTASWNLGAGAGAGDGGGSAQSGGDRGVERSQGRAGPQARAGLRCSAPWLTFSAHPRAQPPRPRPRPRPAPAPAHLCSRTSVLARRPQLGMNANSTRAASYRPSSKQRSPTDCRLAWGGMGGGGAEGQWCVGGATGGASMRERGADAGCGALAPAASRQPAAPAFYPTPLKRPPPPTWWVPWMKVSISARPPVLA
jgi:hypothetical protein